MPRFPEEVQKRIDKNHEPAAKAFSQSNALMSVPPEARLAMPSNFKKFFFVKRNYLGPERVRRIIEANENGIRVIPEIAPMNPKVKKVFGVQATTWGSDSYNEVDWKDEKDDNELQCFNSYLEDSDKMPKWKWTTDRHLSAILWLSDGPDFLEFPFLIAPPDDLEPKTLKPEAGTLVIFPSHPMYAFKYLEAGPVHYLEYHASVKGAKRPFTSSQ